MEHQTKRFDVFGDSMDGTLFSPVELTRSHERVLRSWLYDAEGGADRPDPRLRSAFPTPDNWDIFVPEESALLGTLATGWYFEQTFASSDDDDASADDYRIQALVAALSGEPLDAEAVLDEYVDRLLEDEGEDFPSFRVAAQYAQLCALADADLLTGRDVYAAVAEPLQLTDEQSTDMQQDTPARADGGNVAAARETKLEQFLEQTPPSPRISPSGVVASSSALWWDR